MIVDATPGSAPHLETVRLVKCLKRCETVCCIRSDVTASYLRAPSYQLIIRVGTCSARDPSETSMDSQCRRQNQCHPKTNASSGNIERCSRRSVVDLGCSVRNWNCFVLWLTYSRTAASSRQICKAVPGVGWAVCTRRSSPPAAMQQRDGSIEHVLDQVSTRTQSSFPRGRARQPREGQQCHLRPRKYPNAGFGANGEKYTHI